VGHASIDAERFVRQLLLPEIGEAGQARLGASRAALGGPGAVNEVASRYACAAGVAAIDPGPIDVAVLAPAEVAAHPGPRAVLAGARAALAAIREGVGLPPRAPRTEVAAGLPAAGRVA
jgi:hypothetical protein